MNELIGYLLSGLLASGWGTTALINGRRVHQKDLVQQLQDLVQAQGAKLDLLQGEVDGLKAQNAGQETQLELAWNWIEYLEDIIGENPELVRQRAIARKQRRTRPSRPANHRPAGNRTVR